MAHFFGVCHMNCALRYVGGVLELRKFNGLKGQFDAKKVNFGGLIAEIGNYRPIFASAPHL